MEEDGKEQDTGLQLCKKCHRLLCIVKEGSVVDTYFENGKSTHKPRLIEEHLERCIGKREKKINWASDCYFFPKELQNYVNTHYL